jgi:predicted polyphosphate/ATP-dependent NAD kinase
VKRLGLIVNPVAGVGGKVGLKGSDGLEIVRRALELGAVREAPHRAELALARLARLRDVVEIVACPGQMGEDEARACGFDPVVLAGVTGVTAAGRGRWGVDSTLPDGALLTTPADTEAAARAMRDMGVDLLLFAGGDGTARNICNAVDGEVAALGVPAGVKIHSAVYATTPASAGDLAALFLHDRPAAVRLREAEVMDIDEDAFRDNRISARLYGYLRVPYERTMVQSAKAGGVAGDDADLRAIAAEIVNEMRPGTLYLLGPGTTTRGIAEALGIEKTLLGVDAVRDGRLVAADLSERDILALLEQAPLERAVDGARPAARIVVTVIGGQGYILGRGNQQLSAEVIRRAGTGGIVVVASQTKLLSLNGGPLLVDTGDPELDGELSGYLQVVTNLGRRTMYKVVGIAREPAAAEGEPAS